MTEIRNVAADLSRFKRRVIVIGLVVLAAFGLLCMRLVYLQVVRHEDLAEQAESNRTAIVPVVPNRGLILDRNGIVLASNYSAYTLEITPSKVGEPRGHHRQPGRGDRDHAARPPPLQAAARGLAQLRLGADPHPADRRGSRALRGAALSLPRRRDQGAPVPQLPLRRTRQPRARLHRPHQPGREGGDGRLGRRGPGQLQGHRVHRQARRRAELREDAARPDRRRADGNLGRRPRGAPARGAPGHAGQHRHAVARHQAAEAGRGHVRRPARRAGGDRPARPARSWPSSASRPSIPTCSSKASTPKAGRR